MTTMTTTLTDKVALVTGGAKRVGAAMAMRFAEQGMHIAITYRTSRDEAAQLVAAVESLGRRAIAIEADFADAGAAQQVYDTFTKQFDRLDVLVNNASYYNPSPRGQVTGADFDKHMAINARTPLLLSQLCAPRLATHYVEGDSTTTGRIINFIDIHVMGQPLAGYLAYNCSKAALHEFTKTAAMEFAPQITVNAIAPGVVDWPDDFTDAMKASYLSRVPLARAGTPEDAADAALYLARDARYCTGQIIRLDGGRLLT